MAAKLEQQIALQMQRLNYFEKFAKQLCNEKLGSMSLSAVSSHIDFIEKKWDQFESLHNSLYNTKNDEILTSDYHMKEVFDEAQLLYVDLRAKLFEKKEKVLEGRTPTGKDLLDNSAVASAGIGLSHSLPEIKLPVFSGDPMEWVPFRDLFLAIIGKDINLQPASKMYYLKTQLTGEPKALIESLPPSNESFQPAWDLLVRRYDNPRLLLKRHAESILYGSHVTVGSATQLKELISSNTRALDSLKALGSEVSCSDVLLITSILNKLDSHTVARWETKLGLTKDFPTYDMLLEFLELTARVWEGSENIHNQSLSTNNSTIKSTSKPSKRPLSLKSPYKPAVSYQVMAKSSGTPVETTDVLNECAVCSAKHFVLFCPKFRVLSTEEKVATVKKLRLCFNCLGKHKVHDCTNKNRCQKCRGMHHTEIHFDNRNQAGEQRRVQNSVTSSQAAEPKPSTSGQSN